MYKLAAKCTTAQFMAKEKMNEGKNRIKKFFTEEAGGTEFIAIILILVVVIALGVMFKDNIIQIASNLWAGLSDDSITSGTTTSVDDPFAN